MSNLQAQAKLVANRVNATTFGFDPLTILTLVTTLLPLLMSCFNRNDEPNPSLVSASFRRYHERNPTVLRKRTMRRIRAEATENLSKEQAYALADAVIAQALETDAPTAMACSQEAGV